MIFDRSLLDSSDKRLHTACTTRGIPFEWPISDTGRSSDESEDQREKRRKNLRRLLEIHGRNRRNNITRHVQNDVRTQTQEAENGFSRGHQKLPQSNNPQNNNLARMAGEHSDARYAQDVLQCNQIIEQNSIGYRLSASNTPLNECKYCGALLWVLELISMCCSNRKVKLSLFPNPPALIKHLWESSTEEARIFREYSRFLNNALAMTPLTQGDRREIGKSRRKSRATSRLLNASFKKNLPLLSKKLSPLE